MTNSSSWLHFGTCRAKIDRMVALVSRAEVYWMQQFSVCCLSQHVCNISTRVKKFWLDLDLLCSTGVTQGENQLLLKIRTWMSILDLTFFWGRSRVHLDPDPGSGYTSWMLTLAVVFELIHVFPAQFQVGGVGTLSTTEHLSWFIWVMWLPLFGWRNTLSCFVVMF